MSDNSNTATATESSLTSNTNDKNTTSSYTANTNNISSYTIESISDDILHQLLSFLSGRDLALVDCVNKHFHRLCSNQTLWKNLALQHKQWPFDNKCIDREYLELYTLKHMRNVIKNIDSNTNDETTINWKTVVQYNDSKQSDRGTSCVMLDMGSCTCVVGIGGSDTVPNPFPTISLSSSVVGDDVALLAGELSSEHSISLPILHANETGVFQYAEPVFNYALKRVNIQDYKNGAILLSDQLIGGQNAKHDIAIKRQKIAELVFKINPHIPRIAFVNESLLSLLSTGRTTGIVLHIGFARSTCAVIVDSKIQNLVSLPSRVVGGQLHSRMMLQSVFARGQAYQPSIADMFTHVPILKQYCYVCKDPDEELKKNIELTSVDVELDKNTKVTLQQERFTSSEVFFFFGFPAMVIEAINSSTTWECNQHLLDKKNNGVANAHDKHRSTVMASNANDTAHAAQQQQQLLAAQQQQQQQQHRQQLMIGQQLTPEQMAQAATLHTQQLQQHAQQAQQAQLQHSNNATNDTISNEPTPKQQQQLQQSQINATVQPATSAPAPAPAPPAVTAQSQHQQTMQHDEANDINPALTQKLLQNIVLSGRSAVFPGFAQRFQSDLNYMLNKDKAASVVSAELEATWLGGSVLSKLAVLDELCVTRDEFNKDPYASIVNKMEFVDNGTQYSKQNMIEQHRILQHLQQQILQQQQTQQLQQQQQQMYMQQQQQAQAAAQAQAQAQAQQAALQAAQQQQLQQQLYMQQQQQIQYQQMLQQQMMAQQAQQQYQYQQHMQQQQQHSPQQSTGKPTKRAKTEQ